MAAPALNVAMSILFPGWRWHSTKSNSVPLISLDAYTAHESGHVAVGHAGDGIAGGG
jgi:hypothetical protein